MKKELENAPPEPREPAAREAAKKSLYEKLGFAFMAQNSALTVTIFEPKFRVASLHQLDKKWDVVYLMDKAWELLVKLQIESAELRAERDKHRDESEFFQREMDNFRRNRDHRIVQLEGELATSQANLTEKEAEYESLRKAFYRMADEKDSRLAQWKTWGIVEIAVRNPQVADYCKHWEGRAEAAEASLLQARLVIEAARCIRHWHDSGLNNEGTIVSAEHVRKLWEALGKYDEFLASTSAPEGDLNDNGCKS